MRKKISFIITFILLFTTFTTSSLADKVPVKNDNIYNSFYKYYILDD